MYNEDEQFKEFMAAYQELIDNDYNELEELRLDMLKKYQLKQVISLIIIMIGIAIYLLIITKMSFDLGFELILAILFAIIFFLPVYSYLSGAEKEYRTLLKLRLLPYLLKTFGDIKYRVLNAVANSEEGYILGLSDYWNVMMDDKFEGEYNNLKFQIYEGYMTPRRYAFIGMVFPKRLSIVFTNLKNSEIKRLSRDFYDKLDAFSRILYSEGDIKVEMKQEKVIISMWTKRDVFEVGELKTPLRESGSIYRLYNDLNFIYKIIDLIQIEEDL